MEYITIADVDAILGAGWAGQGDPARAVLMSNAWLSERIRRDVGVPVPAQVLQAGAEIAKDAASGKLYQATGREITSQEVSAQPGTGVKKAFAAGSVARTAGENFAESLIAPWGTVMRKRVVMLKRT